jgi:CubicO group peptidase (beta-lactamase class C family)
MLSAIVTKATGETVLEYLKPRLFARLGIEAPEWAATPEGYSLGGYGLFIRTEDIAKFGQLYLQKGVWEGKPILPASWVAEATAEQVDNSKAPSANNMDWQQGYGFQFWRCRHNAFRGDGKDGQFCIVMPDEAVVIVMTAKNSKLQDQLNVVWDELLPGISAQPLASNPVAESELKQFAATLGTGENKK